MGQRVSAILLVGLIACAPAKEQTRLSQAAATPPAGQRTPSTLAASTQARAAPNAPAPQPRAVDLVLGSAQPVSVQAVSPVGNWVAFCQAGDSNADGKVEVEIGPRGELGGDALTGYLALPSGDLPAIDEIVAHDLAGKSLIYLRGGRTLLRDVERGTELDLDALGADTRRDALRYRPHRSLALDAEGRHLLYVKRPNGKPEVVIRDLVSGADQSFDPGPGEIWRAELEPSGRFIVLRVIRDDTDKNGRLQWPVPEAKAAGPRCASPIPTYADYSGRGDREEVVLIPRQGGKAKSIPNFVSLLGEAIVRRDAADGRLLLERATGTVELTNDKCTGRVVHADGERGLLVVGCQAPKSKIRVDLVLVGPGLFKPLGLDLALTELDRMADGSPRLLRLYPGADTVLLDMDQKAVHKLEPGDQVVATFANRALVRRQNRLLYLTVDPAGSTELGVQLDKNPDVLVQGGFAYVSPWLVDLVTGKAYGPVPKRALGLSRSGDLLVADGGDPSAEKLAIGPLRWLDLTP